MVELTDLDLLAEVRRIEAIGAAKPAEPRTDEFWEAHSRERDRAYDAIEALPLTPGNAVIRARAALAFCDDDLAEFERQFDGQEYLAVRLVIQVVRSLAAGGEA